MSERVPMTDIEFLSLPGLTQQNHLYLYRRNSALLRPAIRAKVTRQAELDGRDLKDVSTYSRRAGKYRSVIAEPEEEEGSHVDRDEGRRPGESKGYDEPYGVALLPSMYRTVAESSLFGETLTVHDLGDKAVKHPRLDDIEDALDLIAKNAAQQTLCLLVPETHELVKSERWRAAVDAIGLIEEPMVTPKNYLLVARSYFPQSRLGDLRYLSNNRRFLSRLRTFVDQKPCTPFELSMQIDIIVLGEMEGGEFGATAEMEARRAERWVLPETLRRFLDSPDTPSLSALMKVIDGLRHHRMLEPQEILTRLYRATAGTLESRDRRYRRLEDPRHCVWAALLLANEDSFLKGNTFVSLDYVCQKYGRASGDSAWFTSIDGWQAIVPLLQISVPEKPNRLDKARLELQRALRDRLDAMRGQGVEWFRSLVCIQDQEATVLSSKPSSASVAEAG